MIYLSDRFSTFNRTISLIIKISSGTSSRLETVVQKYVSIRNARRHVCSLLSCRTYPSYLLYLCFFSVVFLLSMVVRCCVQLRRAIQVSFCRQKRLRFWQFAVDTSMMWFLKFANLCYVFVSFVIQDYPRLVCLCQIYFRPRNVVQLLA